MVQVGLFFFSNSKFLFYKTGSYNYLPYDTMIFKRFLNFENLAHIHIQIYSHTYFFQTVLSPTYPGKRPSMVRVNAFPSLYETHTFSKIRPKDFRVTWNNKINSKILILSSFHKLFQKVVSPKIISYECFQLTEGNCWKKSTCRST